MEGTSTDDKAFKAHKTLFNEVLNGLEMAHYPQTKQWQHYKPTINNKNKLTRIYGRNIITPGNKTIKTDYYIYFYTDRKLNISYYKDAQ